MRDFFASLRYFLAYVNLEKMNLGSIAHTFIRGNVIPRLQKKLDGARTDSEREFLVDLIAKYEEFANPKTRDGGRFDQTAADIVKRNVAKSGMKEQDMEDLMQDVAIDFLSPLKGGVDDLSTTITKFNIEDGPLKLVYFWMHIVDLRVRYHIREIQRKSKEETLHHENDEGEEVNPFENFEAPSRVDVDQVQKVQEELPKYMHKNLRTPVMNEIFDRWYDLAQLKGAHKVDMRNDIWKPLVDSGVDMAYTTFNGLWNNIRQGIVRFFSDELGNESVPMVKNMLHLSSVEAVTYVQYRRRLAGWMLGGILRANLGL